MMSGERRKHKHRSRSRSPSPERTRRKRSRSRSPRRKRRSRSRSRSPPDRRDYRKDKAIYKGEKRKLERKEKESLKALETPEEKRARRLAKKEAKERKKRKEMGWDEQDLGYTNADNPFGDAHLLESFVWHKKREKEGEKHLDSIEQRRREKMRQDETRRELEKVKQRRLEREQEMAMREDERERLQREKESEYYKEWEEQEDQFHLEQAKLRSKIRIQDGRSKPIDLLAQYVSNEDEDLEIQMHEPYRILVGLAGTDLEDLLEDIKVYMELEQGKNVEFWKDMTTVCKDELRKLRKKDPSQTGQVDRRESIHSSVNTDVANIFLKKTYSQLLALQKQINQKIASGDAVDIGYWESLLHQLKAYLAKARLRERHQAMLQRKLADLRKQKTQVASDESESDSEVEQLEKDETIQAEEDQAESGNNTEEDIKQVNKNQTDEGENKEVEPQEASIFSEEDLNEQGYIAYEEGKYSPKLIKTCDVEESLLVDPEEDLEKLEILRQEVLSGGFAAESSVMDLDGMVNKEASKGMGPDEEAFNVPVPVTQKKYLWSDKYRPRKPRFFNRVHTGYEWNKYNQTHYDSDNPPPKIVQGYKFNIFYPDLIDKTQAPEYHLEPCADSKDFTTLRFHAGPPYEDIAFKVVNREWEYSHRHGFRSQFQNNIFQLWFHFKRYRYRR